MICPDPACPIERLARAMDSYIKGEEQNHGHSFSAEMDHCSHCERCEGKLVCWKRRADGTMQSQLKIASE